MIVTDRLILRPWREDDRAPFAALNADPFVRAHFPALLTRAESEAELDVHQAHWDREGFGYGAIERRADGAFLGLAGLRRTPFARPFGPAVDIAWRLRSSVWGRGYAGEAALAWLEHGFAALGLPRIVAFTAAENRRSRALMRRLGMVAAPALDFDHPALPPGHPLARHVTHALDAADWRARASCAARPERFERTTP